MPIRTALFGLALSSLVTLGACKKREVSATLTSSDASVAEPGVVEGEGLSFKILRVYRNQEPTKTPPFHGDGGLFTYFDAKTAGGATFTFAFAEPKPGAMGMAFGDVILAVASAEDGEKLVAEVAHVFHGKNPPAHRAASLPPPEPFRAVFLASDANRTGAGGFTGLGGGYYATKLFLQRRALEAEVFFNFNLATKTGEFAQKDPDYADDMVAFFAGELRDGPPPVRDPRTEPRMSAAGPRVTWTYKLDGEPYGMSPEGDRFWLTRKSADGGTRLVSASLDKEGDEQEVLSVAHRMGIDGVRCAASTCVVVDERPKIEGVYSNDPSSVMLVNRATRTQREISGPWGEHPSFPNLNPLSSDGRMLVVGHWRPSGEGEKQVRDLYLVDVADGTYRGPVDLGKEPWEIVQFSPVSLTLAVGDIWDKTAKMALVDVDTKSLAVSGRRPKPEEPPGQLSPDKRRRATCSEDGSRITVIDLTTKAPRTFETFEEDQRALKNACPSWVSPRYLAYGSGFLDTTTMKFSVAFAPSDPSETRVYDRAFKHVVAYDDPHAGARVGKIELP